MRILVIKTSSFGDIVHLFPALALFHQTNPDAEIDFVINPEFVPLLEQAPFPVRKKIIFERKKLGNPFLFLQELVKLIRKIRQEKYDFAVDYQGLFRSGFITGISRAEVKAGFAVPRESFAGIFYNRKITVNASHAVESYGELTEKLFSISGKLQQQTAEADPAAAAELPELPERYAVLLPGARWQSKRFPPEFFGKVTALLLKKFPDLHFIAVGTADESNLAQAIADNVINLAGKTSLSGLFELLRNAEFILGNDSGPLHAAAALKRPVFGLYGASSAHRSGPWGENTYIFSTGNSCCGCRKRICPDGSYRCFNLNPESVAESIIKVLEKKP